MIISVTVENWMSFKEPTTFNMTASRERQHGDRVPRIPKYQTRILPITAIYGGNASGKTNFFKAINFARQLVTRGSHPDEMIAIEPFKLDKNSRNKPVRMSFELLIDELIYEFSFAVTRKTVVEERLIVITSTSERTLYDREGDKPNFDPTLKETEFLNFAFQGTRDNQLFLTNSVSQKVNDFKPVYDWFNETLVLIAPDARFQPFGLLMDEVSPIHSSVNQLINLFDTGISRITGKTVPIDALKIDAELLEQIERDVTDKTKISTMLPKAGQILIERVDGELVAKKMVTVHADNKGESVEFELHQESDGTRRVMDLLPALLMLCESPAERVIMIDELDRSLHSLLTRQLLETYLESVTQASRNQLLFTTHDLLLMDQQILRRDEMWVAERDNEGVTTLIPFSDYREIRYDKDIRKSYLEGRLGGIPRISKPVQFSVAESSLE